MLLKWKADGYLNKKKQHKIDAKNTQFWHWNRIFFSFFSRLSSVPSGFCGLLYCIILNGIVWSATLLHCFIHYCVCYKQNGLPLPPSHSSFLTTLQQDGGRIRNLRKFARHASHRDNSSRPNSIDMYIIQTKWPTPSLPLPQFLISDDLATRWRGGIRNLRKFARHASHRDPSSTPNSIDILYKQNGLPPSLISDDLATRWRGGIRNLRKFAQHASHRDHSSMYTKFINHIQTKWPPPPPHPPSLISDDIATRWRVGSGI
jgi:hypothetical protein